MEEENKTIRLRTTVGDDAPNVLNVKLGQTYDTFKILSLEVRQRELYRMPVSNYGVLVGRVEANGGFGVPNSKVSVFIPYDELRYDAEKNYIYAYDSVYDTQRENVYNSTGLEGIRYNLLPHSAGGSCHRDVGSLFGKEMVLDNHDVLEVFESYYKYTTRTNNAGDYMIIGVPTGQQTVHMDVDLSDIGMLSQTPRDMIYKGYSPTLFESPTMFKKDSNLNVLPQIKTADRTLTVYPYWGDDDGHTIAVTRCDFQVDYRFEPTCVFMGSVVSDSKDSAISHRCVPSKESGKMSEMVTGEGTIEMIRKTFDGRIEETTIQGNRLIDSDGVWCYQIPMNLDYVVTDEFGNVVPSDNPERGIATHARVRFRMMLDEVSTDDMARKRAYYLVPNNPKDDSDHPAFQKTHDADYEFGTFTKDESFADLFWNKVYSVKSYIPRVQKTINPDNGRFTGIKGTNNHANNNPMPYNSITIRMGFLYRFLCILLETFVRVVKAINGVLSRLSIVIAYIGWLIVWLFGWIPSIQTILRWFRRNRGESDMVDDTPDDSWTCGILRAASNMIITLNGLCSDEGANTTYAPGVFNGYENALRNILSRPVVKRKCPSLVAEFDAMAAYDTDVSRLFNCIENYLAEENEVTSFNFQNDWVNGVLYAPMWYRKVKAKRKVMFGLIELKSRDYWCSGLADSTAPSITNKGLKLYHNGAVYREFDTNGNLKPLPYDESGLKEVSPFGNTLYYNPKIRRTDANGYGFKTHKRSLAYFQLDYGLIVRKETKNGQFVYYYKSVDYDKKHNVTRPLFATDIVLLGSLEDCDKDGVPMFFKHLPSTTYQMPPYTIEQDFTVNGEESTMSEPEDGDDGLFSGNDDVNEKVDGDSVHTSFSGRDWGNAGVDQWHRKWNGKLPYQSGIYVYDGGELMDSGGLFYGITCNTSFVKPKSVINLTRICELGVSLDEDMEIPTYPNGCNGDIVYRHIAPDGYISYDELVSPEIRAMFATMNGNNLKTKTDERTGYEVYDFRYLYPNNFDASASILMAPHYDKLSPNGYVHATNMDGRTNPPSVVSSMTTMSMEQYCEDYVTFRFGGKPKYYQGYHTLGVYKGYTNNRTTEAQKNGGNRFPVYDNSFYFYFGLKPGSTAIDKFMSRYYAECKTDSEARASIDIESRPNSWCSNDNWASRDGYMRITMTGVALPCTITFDGQGTADDYEVEDVNVENIMIGRGAVASSYTYTRLYDDNNILICLSNGNYLITITDANGETYEEQVNFTAPYITFDADTTNFRLDNASLLSQFSNDYIAIAHDTTGVFPEDRQIGGYVRISDVNIDGTVPDFFSISVMPVNPANFTDTTSGYHGYTFNVINGTPVIPTSDLTTSPLLTYGLGNYYIGLPKGGVQYKVTLTQLCYSDGIYNASANSATAVISPSSPIPYRMYGNGISVLNMGAFATGWSDDTTGNENNIVGWVDSSGTTPRMGFDAIGATSEVTYDSSRHYSDSGYLGDLVDAMATSHITGTPYTWADENILHPSYDSNTNEITNLEEYDISYAIGHSDSDPAGVILTTYDPYYTVYNGVYYENVGGAYQLKATNNVTLEDFYDNAASEDERQALIAAVNGVYYNRRAFADEASLAFTLRSSDGTTNLTVTATTEDTPLRYLVKYVAEAYDETSQETVIETGDYELLDAGREQNVVYGVELPTITNDGHFYSEDDGNGNTIYKKPYYIATSTASNKVLPNGMTISQFNASNPNINVMFGIHLIDKRPTLDVISWGAVEDFPYYTSGATIKTGDTFSIPPFFSGTMTNGISSSDTLDALFNNQSIDNNDVSIRTLTTLPSDITKPDEMALPTRRAFYTDDDTFEHYMRGGVTVTGAYTAIPLTTGTHFLNISDGYGDTYATIRSSMRVRLTDITYTTYSIATMTFSTDNDGDGTTYRLYNYVESTPNSYPLFEMASDMASDGRYNGTNYGVMGSDTTPLDENTTGVFQGVSTGIYFVIALSDNGTNRAISPVYDTRPLNMSMSSQGGSTYTFTVTQVSPVNYYLDNCETTVVINYDNQMTDTLTLQPIQIGTSVATSVPVGSTINSVRVIDGSGLSHIGNLIIS